MRVQLVFEMSEISVTYRLGTLSIIKEMVRKGSSKYYAYLFMQNKKEMKPFTYSTYITDLTIQQEKIFGKELHLTISSPDYEFIMRLMNGCKKGEVYHMKNSNLTLKKKRLLPKTSISKSSVIFRTLSPVLIETKQGKPLLATDDKFNNEFKYAAHLILHRIYGKEPIKPIQVQQTMMTKQVIKENLHQEQNRPLYLTANKGLIQLQGHPDDLQCLYDAGVSMRRSLGFGLLEIVEEVN